MSERFKFDGYILREADQTDLALAITWTMADPAHQDVDPTFWTYKPVGSANFILENIMRLPVFFIRIDRIRPTVAEIHIQFDTTIQTTRGRLGTMSALIRGIAWLEKVLWCAGFRIVYFRSRNASLLEFCRTRLGFENGIITESEEVTLKKVLEWKEEDEKTAGQIDGSSEASTTEENRSSSQVLCAPSQGDR